MRKSKKHEATREPAGPASLAEVVAEVFWRRGLRHAQRRQQLEAAWSQVVAPEWAERIRLGSWRRGVLEVWTQDAVLLHQLANFRGQEILHALQRQLGPGQVRRLRFRLG
ncbi:hypothetical protein HRbin36_01125 [bacterium HR36]|nr:hypothetical protein HRbin36_01125 [bacterium HR36]